MADTGDWSDTLKLETGAPIRLKPQHDLTQRHLGRATQFWTWSPCGHSHPATQPCPQCPAEVS